MAHIGVRIPDAWIESIDQARGDVARSAWVRGVVLRALRSRGVRGLREPNPVSVAVLESRLRRAKRGRSKARLRQQLQDRRRASGGKRAKASRKRRLDDLKRLTFLASGVCVRGDGVQAGHLLGVGSGGRLVYESDLATWSRGQDAYGQLGVMIARGEDVPACWRAWHEQQRAWARERKKR